MELDIYQYDDFRQYLRDAFELRKKAEPNFSHRQFADLAGVKNSGTLLHVIQGKRALSPKVMEACNRIFGHKPVAAEFFRLLVDYKQCKDSERKVVLARELQTRRAHSNFVRLNPAQVRYYEDTAYPLIFAAIETLKFRGNFEELAGFLRPPLPLIKVKRCVRDLCEWGLVRLDSANHYHTVSRFVEPPPNLRDPVRQMNRDWIMQSAEAIQKIPAAERQMNTAILSISEGTRAKILDRLEACRSEIFALAQADSSAETVMQLSMLFFPKSRTRRAL